ncbi:MAG: TIGR00730 family Rossman fold protein, partial [Limnobacter sp.]|nr:TIGR00730 family Rossman fold protein [Limnobacter sp.]
MVTNNKNVPTLRQLPSKERSTTVKARESWHILGIMAEFIEATEKLSAIRPSVSIFGSARTRTDHPSYQLTEEIALELSKAGFAVTSGGGPGIMEAANKGAHAG